MTIQDVLETYLTQEEQVLWHINHINGHNDTIYHVTDGDVITGAFGWTETPEGHSYWYSIYNRVNNDIRIKSIKPHKIMNKHKFV